MQSNVLLYDKKLIDLHMFSIKDRESCERKYVVAGPLFFARMGNICAK